MNTKKNNSFHKTVEKELINDVEVGIEEEIKNDQPIIFKAFKKIIEFFFLKIK